MAKLHNPVEELRKAQSGTPWSKKTKVEQCIPAQELVDAWLDMRLSGESKWGAKKIAEYINETVPNADYSGSNIREYVSRRKADVWRKIQELN